MTALTPEAVAKMRELHNRAIDVLVAEDTLVDVSDLMGELIVAQAQILDAIAGQPAAPLIVVGEVGHVEHTTDSASEPCSILHIYVPFDHYGWLVGEERTVSVVLGDVATEPPETQP